MPIRHDVRHRPQPRGITPRRLSAAKRTLQRERDRFALFADQIAKLQPTPQERITQLDQQQLAYDQDHRDLAAKHWRWGRRQLDALSDETRRELLATWNASWIPPTAAYFADFVRRQLRSRGILPSD